MPTYNCGHLISRAITSVLIQQYKYWELIIIDNYSSDNTLEIVKNFNDHRIKCIQINNDGVIAVSRNKGISIAEGYWIAFLDADDWWTPDKLKVSIEALDNGYDFIYHDLYVYYEKKNFLCKNKVRTKQLKYPAHKFLIENGNVITNSSVVLKASILKKINGVSEDSSLVAAEDYDCWLRVAKETEKFKCISGCYGFYWIGENNTSSANKTITSHLAIIKSHYGDINQNSTRNLNISNLLFAIIKSHFILRNYEEAKIYNKIIKTFPIQYFLKFKLLILNLQFSIKKLIK